MRGTRQAPFAQSESPGSAGRASHDMARRPTRTAHTYGTQIRKTRLTRKGPYPGARPAWYGSDSTNPLRMKNVMTASWPANRTCAGEYFRAAVSPVATPAPAAIAGSTIVVCDRTTVAAARPRTESSSSRRSVIRNPSAAGACP